MELEIKPAFPTLIGQLIIPDAEVINRDLLGLILAEEAEHPTSGHSNIGGWRGRTDFLNARHPAVGGLRAWLTWALRRMINASAGPNAFNERLYLSGWPAICRDGAYHAPHSHPDSGWSGVYYVAPGDPDLDRPLNGVLEFLDPRSGAEAVTAPGDPYGEPVRIRPQSGLLVIFPSWLYHWVHPYTSKSPRVAISFNAALAPPAKRPIAPGVGSDVASTATRSVQSDSPTVMSEEDAADVLSVPTP